MIDFAVGYGYNRTYNYDGTGLEGTLTLNTLTSVPEPSTWLLLLSGFALMGTILRRRFRAD